MLKKNPTYHIVRKRLRIEYDSYLHKSEMKVENLSSLPLSSVITPNQVGLQPLCQEIARWSTRNTWRIGTR